MNNELELTAGSLDYRVSQFHSCTPTTTGSGGECVRPSAANACSSNSTRNRYWRLLLFALCVASGCCGGSANDGHGSASADNIQRIKRLRDSGGDYFAAEHSLRSLLSQLTEQQQPHAGMDRVDALQELSRTQAMLKQFAAAVDTQWLAVAELHEVVGVPPGTSGGGARLPQPQLQRLIIAYVALIDALTSGRRYEEAASSLRSIRALAQGHLPEPLKRGLLRVEASIAECAGDIPRAVSLTRRSLGASLARAAAPRTAEERRQALDYLQLLHRTAAVATDPGQREEGDGANTDSSRFAASLVANLSAALVSAGPWAHPLHLPRTFVPGLRASPWHFTDQRAPRGATHGELAEGWPQLAAVAALLRSRHGALASEYRALRQRGLLLPETECIHDAASGYWSFFTSTGHWIPPDRLDAEGCSLDTPAACALLREVDGLGIPGVRALRGGFSAIGGHSVLRPHWGITNVQLKFHLGLVVPTYDAGAAAAAAAAEAAAAAGNASQAAAALGGVLHVVDAVEQGGLDGAEAASATGPTPCARITVGGVTRPWEEGGVLFFDDSWLHSVVHVCDAERVVFQLVISHPEWGSGPGGQGGSGDGAGAAGPTAASL